MRFEYNTFLKGINNTLQEDDLRNYRFFGNEDGLQKTKFIVNSVCINQNNTINWGCDNGLTYLDLNHFFDSDK